MKVELFDTLPKAKGVLECEVGAKGPWIGVRLDNGEVYGFWRLDCSCYLKEAEAYNVEHSGGSPSADAGGCYGICPVCGAQGKTRERRPGGNDTCENGHVYPSAKARTFTKDYPEATE